MNKIKQTKFKIALITLALYFVEGILKVIFKDYPLTEILVAEGGIATAYIGLRLAQNKWSNNK